MDVRVCQEVARGRGRGKVVAFSDPMVRAIQRKLYPAEVAELEQQQADGKRKVPEGRFLTDAEFARLLQCYTMPGNYY